MKSLSQITILLLITFGISGVLAQKKHALVVAVGDYPTASNGAEIWKDLSSKNDLDLLQDFLKEQKFDDVSTLVDAQATSKGLVQAFEELLKRIQVGDVVYFHFSGHGQQVADFPKAKTPKVPLLDKDEDDGCDEALVMYNAPKEYVDGYQFEEHFVDDQLNYFCQLIRKKLGPKGQLVITLDSCHSGTGTRGDEDVVVRGTSYVCAPRDYDPSSSGEDDGRGFDADFQFNTDKGLAKLTAFFGCKAEQTNREIYDYTKKLGYGSLTYYFIQSVNELKGNASYMNLFSKINEAIVIQFDNAQHPQIEGDDLNCLVFNGNLIQQDLFYTLNSVSLNTVVLDAGTLQGLALGDSIAIMTNTATSIKDGKILYVGVIDEISPLTSTVQMTKAFTGRENDVVKYRAFVKYTAPESATVFVKLDIKNKKVKKTLMDVLSKEKTIVIKDKGYDYLVCDTLTTSLIITVRGDKHLPLRSMKPKQMVTSSSYDSLVLLIKQAQRIDYFRLLEIEGGDVDFTYEIITGKYVKDKFVPDSMRLTTGYSFFLKESFRLKIKNTGSEDFYLNIIDIDPENSVGLVNAKEKNVFIRAGEQKTFILKVEQPPFGLDQIKILATRTPIELGALQKLGGSLAESTRGVENNPLLDFVDDAVEGTRGSSVVPSASDTCIKGFVYEIKR
jgi:hypothetical protein